MSRWVHVLFALLALSCAGLGSRPGSEDADELGPLWIGYSEYDPYRYLHIYDDGGAEVATFSPPSVGRVRVVHCTITPDEKSELEQLTSAESLAACEADALPEPPDGRTNAVTVSRTPTFHAFFDIETAQAAETLALLGYLGDLADRCDAEGTPLSGASP